MISFWLRIGAYGTFIVVMFFVLRIAIKEQEAEEGALEFGPLPTGPLVETVPS